MATSKARDQTQQKSMMDFVANATKNVAKGNNTPESDGRGRNAPRATRSSTKERSGSNAASQETTVTNKHLSNEQFTDSDVRDSEVEKKQTIKRKKIKKKKRGNINYTTSFETYHEVENNFTNLISRFMCKMFCWLKNQRWHIAFLTSDIELLICAEWKGLCYFNNGTNHSNGVVILIYNDLIR